MCFMQITDNASEVIFALKMLANGRRAVRSIEAFLRHQAPTQTAASAAAAAAGGGDRGGSRQRDRSEVVVAIRGGCFAHDAARSKLALALVGD